MHQSLLSYSLEVSLVFGKRLNKEWPQTGKVKVYLVRMTAAETWDRLKSEQSGKFQNTRVTVKTTRKELDLEPRTLPSGKWDTASRQHVDTSCPSLYLFIPHRILQAHNKAPELTTGCQTHKSLALGWRNLLHRQPAQGRATSTS